MNLCSFAAPHPLGRRTTKVHYSYRQFRKTLLAVPRSILPSTSALAPKYLALASTAVTVARPHVQTGNFAAGRPDIVLVHPRQSPLLRVACAERVPARGCGGGQIRGSQSPLPDGTCNSLLVTAAEWQVRSVVSHRCLLSTATCTFELLEPTVPLYVVT